MLTDVDLKGSYRSGEDILLEDFYVPCLDQATTYDRAVGYFSSSLLHMVAVAYSDFIRRDGHMRLICSPAITPADFSAMKAAEDPLALAQDSVRREIGQLLENPQAMPATRLLATLITTGHLQVRIAFSADAVGIFHDKLGIFEDQGGRRVSFVGSANETWAAWGLNHESFEVFCSWSGEADLLRTRRHADYFEHLWNGHDKTVVISRLDEVTEGHLREVADEDLQRAVLLARGGSPEAQRSGRELMEHQKAVLESWKQAEHRGIVAFATGAGKTLTAIEGVRRWTARGGTAVILVPSRDLHRQWEAELRHELPGTPLLLAGAGADTAEWQTMLPLFSSARQSNGTVILVTNATFSSDAFAHRFNDGRHVLLVADEVHRAGSIQTMTAIEAVSTGGSLGLSATYRRQFDERGTSRILDLFGDVLEPVVSLTDAILMGRLVPYDYRLQTLELEADELEKYRELTDRIRIAAVQDRSDEPSEYLMMLLIQRARVLKQARGKAPLAAEVLTELYEPGARWLVYCDSTAQLSEVIDRCLERDLPVLEYHSQMRGDRSAVLRSLADFGGIVVAIRCLDEGVDIPACDTALILASSTVEREYVQRRGRVLRTAPGKLSATINDVLLVDERGGALTRSEAMRALEFARMARNPGARERLRLLISLSSDVDLANELLEYENDEEEV